ncbi:unnamed protein product, partial [marine sediment metagenome]
MKIPYNHINYATENRKDNTIKELRARLTTAQSNLSVAKAKSESFDRAKEAFAEERATIEGLRIRVMELDAELASIIVERDGFQNRVQKLTDAESTIATLTKRT